MAPHQVEAAAEGTVPERADDEKFIKRNPHGNFKDVEASRVPFRDDAEWTWTQAKDTNWTVGHGGNDGGASLKKKHIEIDPYAPGRPIMSNYKLLISSIIPRPIGFISTISKDGTSTNLAPFSFFQGMNYDPPLYIIGHAGGFDTVKDSLRNLVETGECCINIVSEHFVEAANACSVASPYGVSEWAMTGLHPAPCTTVRASRVKEAVFSIECTLVETKEYESKVKHGVKTSVLAIVEGVRFWAREDAINKELSIIDPNVLRPVARLGGITYSRTVEGFELPRPDWNAMKNDSEALGILKSKADGQ